MLTRTQSSIKIYIDQWTEVCVAWWERRRKIDPWKLTLEKLTLKFYPWPFPSCTIILFNPHLRDWVRVSRSCTIKLNSQRFKPVTDEQVFYDKFLCDKFYLTSAGVYMQEIIYDKFSYDKFYLLLWTCQQVYFDNLLVASNVIVERTTRALANHNKCSDYFDKFSLLTHTDEQNL
jgi:hypothetical protein